jgi:hypothetical protein
VETESPVEGKVCAVDYITRDLGYGVEDDGGVYTYRGRELLAYKLIFEPCDGGETVYLFDDEIVGFLPMPQEQTA